MLKIRTEQMEAMAKGMQENFVMRLAKHLKKVSLATERRIVINFLSETSLIRLKNKLDYLMDNGFHEEADLAVALELIELFITDENKLEIKKIVIKEDISTSQKLDCLWNLTRNGET